MQVFRLITIVMFLVSNFLTTPVWALPKNTFVAPGLSEPFDPLDLDRWLEIKTGSQEGEKDPVESLIPKPLQLNIKGLNELADLENHVDVTTGAVGLETTDLFIPSPHIPMEIKRIYKGQQEEFGPLGYGWVFNYNQYLQMYEEFKIVEYRGDGYHQIYNFTENNPDAMVPSFDGDPLIYYNLEDGYYTPASQFNTSTLRRQTRILYTVTSEDGTVYEYFGYKAPWRKSEGPNFGKLTSIKDPHGNRIRLNYSKNGNLSKVWDSFGRMLTFQFTGELLTRVTDPLGRTITYEYDENKNLIKVKGLNGSEETYTYDKSHRLTSWKNALGRTIIYSYNSEGKVIQSVQSDGSAKRTYTYYPDQRKTIVVDRDGATIYDYDEYNNIIRVVDSQNNATNYSWDNAGNLTGITQPGEVGIKYNYEDGKLTKVTKSDGSTISFSYEYINNLTNLIVEQNGLKHIYRHDRIGNLISYTDGLKRTTRFAYDTKGKLTAITEPSGKRISYFYDRYGNLKEFTNTQGQNYRYSFDVVGRLLSFTAPGKKTTTFEYDQGNQPVKVTHPNGAITRYEYNKIDQLTKIIDPVKGTTLLNYNLNGQLIRVSDPKGGEYTYTYDNFGRVVEAQDKLGKRVKFKYNEKDQLIEITDSTGRTVKYIYNSYITELFQTVHSKMLNQDSV